MEDSISPEDFRRLAEEIPKPTIDSFHVHSRQEVAALREHFDTRKAPGHLFPSAPMSLPVHVVDDTPPGVLRAMLDGEVVDDCPVR